jgi:hypothetical protein
LGSAMSNYLNNYFFVGLCISGLSVDSFPHFPLRFEPVIDHFTADINAHGGPYGQIIGRPFRLIICRGFP